MLYHVVLFGFEVGTWSSFRCKCLTSIHQWTASSMPLRSKAVYSHTFGPRRRLCHVLLSAKCVPETAEVMSIAVFIYWVLDVPATFITGFDRGGILGDAYAKYSAETISKARAVRSDSAVEEALTWADWELSGFGRLAFAGWYSLLAGNAWVGWELLFSWTGPQIPVRSTQRTSLNVSESIWGIVFGCHYLRGTEPQCSERQQQWRQWLHGLVPPSSGHFSAKCTWNHLKRERVGGQGFGLSSFDKQNMTK